jgi:hypothetical protein
LWIPCHRLAEAAFQPARRRPWPRVRSRPLAARGAGAHRRRPQDPGVEGLTDPQPRGPGSRLRSDPEQQVEPGERVEHHDGQEGELSGGLLPWRQQPDRAVVRGDGAQDMPGDDGQDLDRGERGGCVESQYFPAQSPVPNRLDPLLSGSLASPARSVVNRSRSGSPTGTSSRCPFGATWSPSRVICSVGPSGSAGQTRQSESRPASGRVSRMWRTPWLAPGMWRCRRCRRSRSG